METSLVESVWTRSKLLVKAGIIVFIVLVLQIPTFYIRDLIEERESRQKEAIAEVSNKWAAKQTVTGPVISIPYLEAGDTNGTKTVKRMAYFLPDELTMNAKVVPQEKYRGIYKVMLYTSQLNLKGSFRSIHPEKLMIDESALLWNEASVRLHISDMKGLNEEPKLNWNGKEVLLTASHESDSTQDELLYAPLSLTGIADLQNVSFAGNINLSGSEQLLFTPVGKSTRVTLSSSWPHPSFSGDILPQSTDIKKDGFTASWNSMAHKRAFPQEWKGNAFAVQKSKHSSFTNITNAGFGTTLFVPVNGYQKTMRSIKYAALCILLTFAAFFLIETAGKLSVHPFQYGLIGLALVLFYTLLLSFSEYIGFNSSYAIASVLTIGLIGWFVRGILQSGRLTTVLVSVLVLMYSYIFTILQLQDYSLLLGSIGLFLTLAVIMYYSKRFKW